MNTDEIIDDLLDRYWNWRLLDIPEFATFVGVNKYDDRLMDLSLNGYLRRRDDARSWLEEAQRIRKITKTKPPCEENILHLDYLEYDLEVFLEGLKHQTYLCPMNQIDGPHVRYPGLLGWMRMGTVEEYELILTRIRQFPRQMSQMMELMNEGIRIGNTAHIKSVQPYPEVLLKISQEKVTESGLYGPFKKQPAGISEHEWKRIVATATEVISDAVLPAFKRLSEFMRDVYLPNTRPGIGVGSLPNGPAIYESYIKFHTDRDVTAQQILDLGKSNLKTLLAKLDEAQKGVGYKGTRQEFITHLRTDPKFGFTSKEEMMKHYEVQNERIMNLLPKIFSKMPKMKLVLVAAPPEVEKEYVCGAYLAGSIEKDRPGYFVLNTYLPAHRKRYDVPGIILHEALPGHHIQLALTAESNQKDYRRFADELRYWDLPAHVGMKSGYHEGWATYAEFLGHEIGLYDDPYDYIGSISRELQLACRYVVDIEMHLNGWSVEKCKDFMMKNCACDEMDIIAEVDRYISLPAQSISYLYGCEKMKEYRAKAEKILGDRFDVRVYHDMIASLGDVPLFIVEHKVDIYISERCQIPA